MLEIPLLRNYWNEDNKPESLLEFSAAVIELDLSSARDAMPVNYQFLATKTLSHSEIMLIFDLAILTNTLNYFLRLFSQEQRTVKFMERFMDRRPYLKSQFYQTRYNLIAEKATEEEILELSKIIDSFWMTYYRGIINDIPFEYSEDFVRALRHYLRNDPFTTRPQSFYDRMHRVQSRGNRRLAQLIITNEHPEQSEPL